MSAALLQLPSKSDEWHEHTLASAHQIQTGKGLSAEGGPCSLYLGRYVDKVYLPTLL